MQYVCLSERSRWVLVTLPGGFQSHNYNRNNRWGAATHRCALATPKQPNRTAHHSPQCRLRIGGRTLHRHHMRARPV